MRHLKVILSVICLGTFLASCKHDNIEGLLGPDLKESGLLCPEEGFEIVPDAEFPSSVDLSTGSLSGKLLLTEEAQWEYGLIGSNGARFSESGFGDEAEINWTGNTSTPFLFKEGDSVQVYYKVTCLDTFFNRKVKIEAPKIYDHILISDLEGNGRGSNWTNVSGQLDEVIENSTEGRVPQGQNFLRLVGSFQDRGSFLGQAQSKLDVPLGVDVPADSLYFNVLVKGSPNSEFEIRVYQLPGDLYNISIPVTWEGWKLVSIKYSDFGETVNRVGKTPNFINEVRVVVRYADGDTQPDYKIDLDFMSFTVGNPLEL